MFVNRGEKKRKTDGEKLPSRPRMVFHVSQWRMNVAPDRNDTMGKKTKQLGKGKTVKGRRSDYVWEDSHG